MESRKIKWYADRQHKIGFIFAFEFALNYFRWKHVHTGRQNYHITFLANFYGFLDEIP